MATELATAYISLVPETSKIAPGLYSALENAQGYATKSGKSMGSKLAAGIGSTLKTTLTRTAMGAGVAVGGALTAGMTKGIKRLSAIEQAQKKLEGLGHSAASVGKIMDNALGSVRGTAFGLEEAATVAASTVAAGVKPGKALEDQLKLVADAATIAGRDMGSMGLIFNKVIAQGKVQGDELMQLSEAGIPVLALLSKQLGKTSQEVSKMVSDGKVNAEMFMRAIKDGMGGAALKSGETTVGAMKNMGAAAGRLGATLSGPFYHQVKGAFVGITEQIDKFDSAIKPTMEKVERQIQHSLVPAFRAAAPQVKQAVGEMATILKGSFSQSDLRMMGQSTKEIFTTLASTAGKLAPTFAHLASVFVKVTSSLSADVWQTFAGVLDATATVAEATLVPLANGVAKLADTAPHVVQLGAAFLMLQKATNTFPALDFFVRSPERMKASFTELRESVSQFQEIWSNFSRVQRTETSAFLQKTKATTDDIEAAFQGPLRGVKALKSGVKTAGAAMVSALGVIGPVVGVAVAAIGTVIAGGKKLKSNFDALEQTTASNTQAMGEFANALAMAGGKLNDAAVAKGVDAVTTSMEGLKKASEFKWNSFDGQLQAFKAAATVWDSSDNRQWDVLKEASDKARPALEGLTQIQKDLGMSSAEMAEAIAQGGPAFDAIMSKAKGLGANANATTAYLRQMRGQIEQAVDAAARASSVERFANMMDILADKTQTADVRLQAFQQSLAILAGRDLQAEQANAQLNEQQRQTAEATKAAAEAYTQMGQSILDANGQIDTQTDAGNQLFQTLTSMQGAMFNTIDAMHQQGASTEEMTARITATRDAFIKQAEASGIATDQAHRIADAYLGIPREVVTMLTTPGLAKAQGALVQFKDELRSVPGQKAVEVKTMSKTAQKDLEDVGFKVKKLPDGKFKITASTKEATAAIDLAKKGMLDFGRAAKENKPKIDADNRPLKRKVEEAKTALNSIPNTKTVTITTREKSVKGHSGGGVAGFSSGGFLPTSGPGTNTTDGILGVTSQGVPIARVDAGEHITRRTMAQRYARELSEINQGTFPKLPGYATGGRVGATPSVIKPETKNKLYQLDLTGFATGHHDIKSIDGAKYVYGGRAWGDNLAMPIALARHAAGLPPFAEVPRADKLAEYLTTLGARPGTWRQGMLGLNMIVDGPQGTLLEAVLPNGQVASMMPIIGGRIGSAHIPGLTQSYVLPAANPLSALLGVQNLPPELLDDDGELLEGDQLKQAIEKNGGAAGLPSLLKSSGTTLSGQSTISGAIGAAVSGQVADILQVFGIGDSMPPIIQALLQLAGIAKDKAVGSTSGSGREMDMTAGRSYKPSGEDIAASMVATTPRYQPGKGVEQWRTTALAALEWLDMSQSMADKVLAEVQGRSKGDTNYSAPAPIDPEEKEEAATHDDQMRVYQAQLAEWEEKKGVDENGKPIPKPRKPQGPKDKEFKDATIHGLMGLTPAEFFQNADSELPKQIYHPLANLVAGLKMMDSDNASLEMLWGEMKHYATGGKVTTNPKLRKLLSEAGLTTHGGDDQIIGAKSGEMVMNQAAVAGNEALLNAMNQGVSLDERSMRAMPANVALNMYDSTVPQMAGTITRSAVTTGGQLLATGVRTGGQVAASAVEHGSQSLGNLVSSIPGIGGALNAVISPAGGITADALRTGSDLAGAGIEALTPLASDIIGTGAEQTALAGSRMMHTGLDTTNAGIPTLTELLSDHAPTLGTALNTATSTLPNNIGAGLAGAASEHRMVGGDTFVFNVVDVPAAYSTFNKMSMGKALAGSGRVMA